ncbi:MAG: 50S ribosomal protein L14 [Candidatus Ranarchaeia archaeon]
MGKKSKRAALGRGGVTFRPKIARGLPSGSIIKVADNSGAKSVKILSVSRLKTRLNRMPQASVGDMCTVAVQSGSQEMRRQLVKAVIIRQRRPFRRQDGSWVQFEDNAAVVVSDEGAPKGTEVRGPMAKEAAESWVEIAKIASIIL